MTETRLCPECGALLPANGPKGLCTQCALDRALAMTHGNSLVQSVEAPTPAAGPLPLRFTEDISLGTFGEYELLEEIARGGMGVVYRAHQKSLGRTVAVKLILGGALAGKEFVQRFRTESAAAAILQHPNIVAIHDVGVHEGRHYFSMDYVEGRSLAQLVGQQPLAPARAARYVELIAAAIHYAHERGILHRDLKPSNVLIDANDQPRITDFGLARRLDGDSSLTMTGQVLGSPNFMPPEQAGAKRGKVGPPSDVYALGGILYYLLTARAPFQADSLEHTLTQVLHGDPVAPRLLDPSIPRDLETITLKCLEKEPSRRFQTAQGLAEELNRFLNHEPILARPITAPEKLWRWSCRKPALASLIILLHLMGAAGLGGILWQLRQSRHLLYVAKMNLTQAAWEQNSVSRAKQLLEETAAAPERSFEWLYWQRQLHREVKALRGHTGPVLAVAYCRDGSKIASASADGTVKVWDAATSRHLVDLTGHLGAIRSVAFFPDGQRIVTGSWDKTVKVWDAVSGELLRTLPGHEKEVFSVAVSPDGRKIASGSFDKTVKVWDTATGELVATFRGHTDRVWAVAFSPDGKCVVSGGWDGAARVWDAESADAEQRLTLPAHAGAVLSVAFSPDGSRIVTGHEDQWAVVWDAKTGAPLRRLRHSAPVFSVGFFPDGRIFTAGDDQTARVWDADTGEELRSFKGHGSLIGSVACSPDGRQIITGGGAVRYSPNGQFVDFSTGDDQTVKIWDTAGNREPRTLEGHTEPVVSLGFSSDGRRLVSASFDGTARLWDLERGGEGRTVGHHSGPIRAVAFLPGNKRIITGSFDGTSKVWDIATGGQIELKPGHTNVVFSVAASPDGQWIATGSWDRTVKVWHAATGQLLFTFHGHSELVYSVAFSPDSRWIVSGSLDGALMEWEVISGKVRFVSNNSANIWSAAYSRDGSRIVTGSHGVAATVWDSTSGRKRLSLKGHTAHVHGAAFSPDGTRIVTSSADRTARLWDAATGEELLTLNGHTRAVMAVAFSPDGQRIATASSDHTIKIWEAATEDQVARWQKEEHSTTSGKRPNYPAK